jgi:hypothetical protein
MQDLIKFTPANPAYKSEFEGKSLEPCKNDSRQMRKTVKKTYEENSYLK